MNLSKRNVSTFLSFSLSRQTIGTGIKIDSRNPFFLPSLRDAMIRHAYRRDSDEIRSLLEYRRRGEIRTIYESGRMKETNGGRGGKALSADIERENNLRYARRKSDTWSGKHAATVSLSRCPVVDDIMILFTSQSSGTILRFRLWQAARRVGFVSLLSLLDRTT